MSGTITLLRATISGMGSSARCELLARKELVDSRDGFGMRSYTYSECTVLKAPDDLSNGAYVITTEDGFTIKATKQRSLWLVGAPRRADPEDQLRKA